MKKYIKYFFFVAFALITFGSFAQDKPKGGAKREQTLKRQEQEKEVRKFIANNLSRYVLTPEREARIKEEFAEEQNEHGSTQEYNIDKVLLEIKISELRKLYFKQYTPYRSYKSILEDDPEYLEAEEHPELAEICVNGGFEDGITDDYIFRYRNVDRNLDFSCDISMEDLALTILTPSGLLNDYGEQITLVNDDITDHDGKDEILSLYPDINISRVHTGHQAIKLNNNGGLYGVSRLSKRFPVNSDFITFSYSLILQNPNPLSHFLIDQPHFIARLYNSNHEIVNSFCIVADVNNTETFNNVTFNNLPLLYTGWQCGTLYTEGIANGEEATLEIIITDCGRGEHYGTVYIDDICVSGECESVFPVVHLDVNPSVAPCPNFPITVCGTFTPPSNINDPLIVGTLQGIEFNILQNGAPASSSITNYTLVGDNGFCFELDESDFGSPLSGNYEYQAIASFKLGTQTIVGEDTSANDGPDAIFSNCIPTPPCPECIDITTDVTSGADHQQAQVCINADNSITGSGTEAVYRAGYEVILKDGFEALSGTVDRFHIEGCTTNAYVAKVAAPKGVKSPKEIQIDLIEVEGSVANIKVYPNPADTEITVAARGLAVTNVSIFTIDGKQVYSAVPPQDSREYNVDLSQLSQGIYMLAVTTTDGAVTTQKIVKK